MHNGIKSSCGLHLSVATLVKHCLGGEKKTADLQPLFMGGEHPQTCSKTKTSKMHNILLLFLKIVNCEHTIYTKMHQNCTNKIIYFCSPNNFVCLLLYQNCHICLTHNLGCTKMLFSTLCTCVVCTLCTL